MENPSDLITTLGVPLGIIIWLVIGIIKLVTEHGPTALRRYQNRKSDQSEHTQDLERRQLRHKEVLDLAEAGSRSYSEEQLTQHLSEVYHEFGTVNSFVRESIATNLVQIERQLDQVIRNTDSIPGLVERLIGLRSLVKGFHDRLEDVIKEFEDKDLPID